MWASLLRTRFKERNVRHPKSSGHPAKSHNEGNSSRVTSESERYYSARTAVRCTLVLRSSSSYFATSC
jgi:hypothetical protein